jgi:hypothetical protein
MPPTATAAIVPPPPHRTSANVVAEFDFPAEILRRPDRKSLWVWFYEKWLKTDDDTEQEKVRRIPSWLLSFVVHLSLLVILAMIPLAQISSGPLVLMFGDSGQDGLSDFELSGAGEDTPEIAEAEFQEQQPEMQFSQLLEALELPSLTEVKVDVSANEATSAITAMTEIPNGIRDGLQGRTGALKGALLNKFGGNGQTEAAVDLGLQWLAKYQMSDGSWSLTGPYTDGGAVENRTAATAMAVNAFLGAGNTPDNGKYAENVRLGLAYLIRRQAKDGFFAGKEPSRQQAYAQAIATIAVCEAFGMTGDSKFRVAAEKALKYAAWSQSDLKGWRYDPDDRKDADLSVTGWYLMALVTGKMVNLSIDEEVFKSVTAYLDMVSHDEKSRYSYTTIENKPDLVMTAEGLLCRIYLGWQRSEQPLLMAIRDDLLPNRPEMSNRTTSVYFWYYATQVLHHVGGEAWQEWNEAMKKVLPALQERKGKESGSWDPESDQFGAAGGRLYVTCFNIYCLEVYYRHLAMYDIK